MPLTTLIDIINQISWSTMGRLIEGNTHFMIINICHGKKRRLKSNIKKWNEIKSYPKLPLLCTERRERFSIRTFLYRPATIVITLITRTPQPHHKTGYHSDQIKTFSWVQLQLFRMHSRWCRHSMARKTYLEPLFPLRWTCWSSNGIGSA